MKNQHVYIGDWLTNSWIQVKCLNVPRFGHSCGKFTLFDGTDVVLVAGGQTGLKMASEVRRLEMYNFQVLTSVKFLSFLPPDTFRVKKKFSSCKTVFIYHYSELCIEVSV